MSEGIVLQPKQRAVLDYIETGASAMIGFGGMSPLESTVYTPDGPVRMGDVHVGTIVSHPDGGSSVVTHVWPHPQTDVYRVRFDDGSSLEVGLKHLWRVRASSKTIDGKHKTSPGSHWEVVDTATLIRLLSEGKRISIPLTEPIKFRSTEVLPVPPYVLGALIGDGSFSTRTKTNRQWKKEYVHTYDRVRLTTMDEEMVDTFGSLGVECGSPQHKKGNRAADYVLPMAIAGAIRELGLAEKRGWEKFIPERYKRASVQEREDLLCGLMDTDGSACPRGHAHYSTCSKQLADDVQELAWSLGYKVSITKSIPMYTWKGQRLSGRTAYKVWIKGNTQERLFRLSRKRARTADKPYNGKIENGSRGGERARRIVSIDFTRNTDCQCITINREDGLYVADDYIVTHNSKGGGKSYCIVSIAAYLMEKYPGCNILIFRRIFRDLNENHIIPMKRRFPKMRKWYSQVDRMIKHPNSSMLKFGYAEHDADIESFDGKEYDFIFVDQSEQCTVYMLAKLKSCRRSTNPRVRKPKMILTFNPGGVSHAWHKRKFVDKSLSAPEAKEGWAWIHAHAWDNVEWVRLNLAEDGITVWHYYHGWTDAERQAYFMEKSEYAQTLNALPDEAMKRAFLWGDFDIYSGQFFTQLRKDIHLVPEDYPESPSWECRGAIDYGRVTVFYTGTRDYNGRVVIGNEVYTEDMAPSARAEAIANMLIARKLWNLTIYCDTDMFSDDRKYKGSDKSPSRVFNEVFERLMKDKAPLLVPVAKRSEDHVKYRQLCNEAMREYMRWELDVDGNMIHKPMLLVKESCRMWWETVPSLRYDPHNNNDIDQSDGTDHAMDASKYLLMALRTPDVGAKQITFEENPREFLLQQLEKDLEKSKASPGETNYMYY